MDKAISQQLRIYDSTKIEELSFYKDKYRKTLNEWKKFVEDSGVVDDSIVPAEVMNAWKRCRSYGLDPYKIPDKPILKGDALESLLERNKEFIEVSRPFLNNLYQFLEGSKTHVCLFDREGYLLEIVGDHDISQLLLEASGVVGALWNEKSAGHNVSGTIVEVKRPVHIFGSQHYLKAYHGETGSGAPIFFPQGEFLGGVTLTARNFRATSHAIGMAVAAAHAIGNELQSRDALRKARTAYIYRDSVIQSIMEALVTVDHEGYISLINNAGRKILSKGSGPLEGKLLSKILGQENEHVLKLIECNERLVDREVRIFSRKYWTDYTLTLTPVIGPEKQSIGKVIVLNEIKRSRMIATRMVGANAVFCFEDICGNNLKFLRTLEQAKMVAKSDSNILLLGQSGTGKDIFAQAIHNASDRQGGPFIAINCGAIPRDLIASEFFGHEEGAFTGSRRGGNQGKFELAEGGTIFLDEIAETPLELQTALLRVIEDKVVTRIGGRQNHKVDVRIIAATNKDLKDEIRKGNFREDLYYRLNVFAIEMVPLRERIDDIRNLMCFFVEKYEKMLGKRIEKIDERIFEAFMTYEWPGNVRELQNVIERMMNFCQSNELTYDLLPAQITEAQITIDQMHYMEPPEETEKKIIQTMLGMKFKKSEIAKKMNISRATLYRKIKKYDLFG